ncbi:MAG: hypothetical protein RJB60_648 [Pseudomonadota bacterium]|jgi:uncharacterized protein
MKARSPRPIVPTKLDIGAFIESLVALDGQTSMTDMPRLAEGLAPEVSPASMQSATWRAQGELVAQRVGSPQTWLTLEAQACLPWTCQRCLQPVELPVEVSRKLRFVQDEATAALLDAELDDDVLVLSRSYDLIALIEDELIMASPIVPFHDECPVVLPMSASDPGVDEPLAEQAPDGDEPVQPGAKPHPFAALAQFKAKKSTS